MRRSERHHLKENPLAIAIAQLQVYFSEWSTGLALGLALVVGTVLAYGGYTWNSVPGGHTTRRRTGLSRCPGNSRACPPTASAPIRRCRRRGNGAAATTSRVRATTGLVSVCRGKVDGSTSRTP